MATLKSKNIYKKLKIMGNFLLSLILGNIVDFTMVTIHIVSNAMHSSSSSEPIKSSALSHFHIHHHHDRPEIIDIGIIPSLLPLLTCYWGDLAWRPRPRSASARGGSLTGSRRTPRPAAGNTLVSSLASTMSTTSSLAPHHSEKWLAYLPALPVAALQTRRGRPRW